MRQGIISQKLKLFMRAKGHVGAPICSGIIQFAKAHEGRHDRAEHHDQAVHGGELVEQLRVHQLQAGLEQLGADQQARMPPTISMVNENSRYSVPMSLWLVANTSGASRWGHGGRGCRAWSPACPCLSSTALMVNSSIRWGDDYLPRWARTSAGCTSWPVLLDQLFLV